MTTHRFIIFPNLGANEYRIREERIPHLRHELEKLWRRADRLGIARPDVREVRTEILDVREVDGDWGDLIPSSRKTGQVQAFRIFTPVGTEVRIGGYHFVATIQHIGEDGNMLRTVPSFDGNLPASYRTDKPTCDHCHTVRLRNETFVVQHESGAFKRIGRNCIKDYLGDESAAKILAAASLDEAMRGVLSDEDGEGGWGIGGMRQVRPVLLLAWTVAAIRTHGWLSRRQARPADGETFDAGRQATADIVWDHLFPPMKFKPTVPKPDDEQVTEAEAALKWAQDINPDTDSDYLHNCRVVAGLGVWTAQQIGIGASIVAAYQREQNRLALMKFATSRPSTYLAAEGAKFGGKAKGNGAPFVATVTRTMEMDGQFGMTELICMQMERDDDNVCDLVWFASGGAVVAGHITGRVERGMRIIVAAATVKRCQENRKNQRPETVLTRCTLWAYSDEKLAELVAEYAALNEPKVRRTKTAKAA